MIIRQVPRHRIQEEVFDECFHLRLYMLREACPLWCRLGKSNRTAIRAIVLGLAVAVLVWWWVI